MAFTNHFYHRLTRKYVSVFGSLFNKLTINRYGNDGEVISSMPVPISFGPWQKSLLKNQADPNLDRKYSILLPRLFFDLENIQYDPERRISQSNKIMVKNEEGNSFVYTPTPYTIYFKLSLIVQNMEDGTQVIEQILPFFQPSYTPSVYLIEGLEEPIDISIDLENVSQTDVYEGDFNTNRRIVWEMSFVMRAYYFGPERRGNIIKFVDVQNKVAKTASFDQNYLGSIVTSQPGMDINGNPTTDIDETITYIDINEDDAWDQLNQVHTFDELLEKDLIDKNPELHSTNGKLV